MKQIEQLRTHARSHARTHANFRDFRRLEKKVSASSLLFLYFYNRVRLNGSEPVARQAARKEKNVCLLNRMYRETD